MDEQLKRIGVQSDQYRFVPFPDGKFDCEWGIVSIDGTSFRCEYLLHEDAVYFHTEALSFIDYASNQTKHLSPAPKKDPKSFFVYQDYLKLRDRVARKAKMMRLLRVRSEKELAETIVLVPNILMLLLFVLCHAVAQRTTLDFTGVTPLAEAIWSFGEVVAATVVHVVHQCVVLVYHHSPIALRMISNLLSFLQELAGMVWKATWETCFSFLLPALMFICEVSQLSFFALVEATTTMAEIMGELAERSPDSAISLLIALVFVLSVLLGRQKAKSNKLERQLRKATKKCCICWVNEVNRYHNPCGHCYLCSQCCDSGMIKTCPICRETVTSFLPVHL
jgi:hypothetical protein